MSRCSQTISPWDRQERCCADVSADLGRRMCVSDPDFISRKAEAAAKAPWAACAVKFVCVSMDLSQPLKG